MEIIFKNFVENHFKNLESAYIKGCLISIALSQNLASNMLVKNIGPSNMSKIFIKFVHADEVARIKYRHQSD